MNFLFAKQFLKTKKIFPILVLAIVFLRLSGFGVIAIEKLSDHGFIKEIKDNYFFAENDGEDDDDDSNDNYEFDGLPTTYSYHFSTRNFKVKLCEFSRSNQSIFVSTKKYLLHSSLIFYS